MAAMWSTGRAEASTGALRREIISQKSEDVMPRWATFPHADTVSWSASISATESPYMAMVGEEEERCVQRIGA